jgi:hypothetical protein
MVKKRLAVSEGSRGVQRVHTGTQRVLKGSEGSEGS